MPDVTPRVLLDTNVLVANFQPGNAYKLLIEGTRTRQLQLIVPERVDLEVESISMNDAQVLRVFDISHASVEEAHTYSEQELLVSLHVECDADVDLDLELEGVDRDSGIRRSAWQTISTHQDDRAVDRGNFQPVAPRLPRLHGSRGALRLIGRGATRTTRRPVGCG